MFSKSMYQEELRQIGDAISAIQCLSNEENEETKADIVTDRCYRAICNFKKIIAIAKAEGMTEKPDMHDTKSGLVYDLEALGHKILVEAGAYWRSSADDLESTVVFTADKASSIINGLIDSISDAEAAFLKYTEEVDALAGVTLEENQEGREDTAKDQDREGYKAAYMHGVKCLAEDLAAGLPAGSGREALKSILKTNYDYTDQDIERLFS